MELIRSQNPDIPAGCPLSKAASFLLPTQRPVTSWVYSLMRELEIISQDLVSIAIIGAALLTRVPGYVTTNKPCAGWEHVTGAPFPH